MGWERWRGDVDGLRWRGDVEVDGLLRGICQSIVDLWATGGKEEMKEVCLVILWHLHLLQCVLQEHSRYQSHGAPRHP